MRKVFLFLIAAFLIWLGLFYWNNLRGARTAFGPPVADITKQISREPAVSENTTGFPLKLPNGFSISIFAKDLDGPRVLAWDPQGTLLASIPSQSRVVALPDTNGDGVADSTIDVATGLNRPHGIAFSGSDLKDSQGLTLIYIAETNQIAVYDYDTKTFKASNKRKIIDLASGRNHVTRTIGFGPDGKLYISVGSSCNVCVEKDQRGKILIADPDGSNLREYAGGLRNSVFFIWHPTTKEMWATDMGRDLIGDNIPPEEVNIVKDGKNYGWPYCWGDRVHDDNFDPGEKFLDFCKTTESPHITFQAHSAPLGLAFIPGSWPAEYRGDLLVSYHGSWNRTEPTGYKVVRFDLDRNGKSTAESDFISGWLTVDGALGRPVDLLFDDKGALYISDDKAGGIYKVTKS